MSRNIESVAAVAPATGEPLVVESVEVRAPESHEVLVQMKASGLCHTDFSMMTGDFPGVALPAVLGHEGAGVVLECGKDVDGVQPGDHVILSNIAHCGVCASCRTGKSSFCAETAKAGSRRPVYTWRGKEIASAGVVASFAGHSVLPAGNLIKIPNDMPFDSAALVPCGVITGMGAVLASAEVSEGSTVVAIGMGSVGLNVIQGARIAGAARIIAVDTNSSKEEVAKRFGATDFLQPIATENTLADQVTELLSGPADYSFECVGNARLIEQALAMVHPFSGVCVAVGIAPGGSELTLPASTFWMGRRLQGTFLGNVNPLTDIPRIVDWYRDGTVLLDELVTHRLNHANINDGFDLVSSGRAVRTVVVY